MTTRLLTDILKLPNSLNDLKFEPNALANNRVFNDRVSMIQQNYNYLKGNATFIDNNSPREYTRVYYFDNNYEGWNVDTANYEIAETHGYHQIHTFTKTDGKYGYILVGVDVIDIFYGDDIIIEGFFEDLTLQRRMVKTQNVGDQSFININSTHLDGDKLYVYDGGLNILLMYDIGNIVTNDEATANISIIKKLSNQRGLISVASDSTHLYVLYDTKLKKFTKDLNELASVDIGGGWVDVEISGDKVFVLGVSGDVATYTVDLQYKENAKISDINISIPETYKQIKKSKLREDILHIVSDRFVHKCFAGKVGDYFSHFDIDTKKPIYSIDAFVLGNLEYAVILDDNKINLVVDTNDIVSQISETNLRDEFSIAQLLIYDLELEQDFVYNAIIQKLVFNHILLVNSILYQISFMVEQNRPRFNGLLNLKKQAISTVNTTFGLNEVFSYQVFGRFVEDIHRIQTIIVDLLQVNVEGDISIPLMI